jgi:hypothetical protein
MSGIINRRLRALVYICDQPTTAGYRNFVCPILSFVFSSEPGHWIESSHMLQLSASHLSIFVDYSWLDPRPDVNGCLYGCTAISLCLLQ